MPLLSRLTGALLLLLLLVPAIPVSAQDWRPDRALITLGSRHIGLDASDYESSRWNEFNPGLILAWEDRGRLGLSYAAGGFINSFGNPAPFVGVSRQWEVAPDLRVGPFIGLSDYGDHAKFFPVRVGSSGVLIGGVQVSYRNVFLQALPARGPDRSGAVVLVGGLTFPLR